MQKIPYHSHYPSAARLLINDGITATPRQVEKDFLWASGIDIIYTLRNLTPANFRKYADTLLLLAYQETMRYHNAEPEKEYLYFAAFDVKLGRLKKGRDLPEIQTYQAHMHIDPDIMVYGPGYETPGDVFLADQVEKILDIVRRYADMVNKQAPFKVVKLTISIRDRRRPGGTVRNP